MSNNIIKIKDRGLFNLITIAAHSFLYIGSLILTILAGLSFIGLNKVNVLNIPREEINAGSAIIFQAYGEIIFLTLGMCFLLKNRNVSVLVCLALLFTSIVLPPLFSSAIADNVTLHQSIIFAVSIMFFTTVSILSYLDKLSRYKNGACDHIPVFELKFKHGA